MDFYFPDVFWSYVIYNRVESITVKKISSNHTHNYTCFFQFAFTEKFELRLHRKKHVTAAIEYNDETRKGQSKQ